MTSSPEAQRERYRLLVLLDLCPKCGKLPPVENRAYCQPCLNKSKEYHAKFTKRMRP